MNLIRLNFPEVGRGEWGDIHSTTTPDLCKLFLLFFFKIILITRLVIVMNRIIFLRDNDHE